jgi:hypothetical protein
MAWYSKMPAAAAAFLAAAVVPYDRQLQQGPLWVPIAAVDAQHLFALQPQTHTHAAAAAAAVVLPVRTVYCCCRQAGP